MQTRIVTDTSTIAVFDLEALRHRVNSDGDWWTSSTFPELQSELASNNLYLIDTTSDGSFEVTIELQDVGEPTRLNAPSGRLFVVCGEEIPADGLTPELIRGGLEIAVKATSVFVSHRTNGDTICVGIRYS